ncbi:MAG: TRAP transporter large permease [Betaproteobacteria bacterium]
MSNLQIGFLGVGAMFVLLMVRVPIGATLGMVSLAGIAAIRGPGAAMGSLATLPYQFSSNWTLSAVPMFLLMGSFAHHMGLTRGLFDAAKAWLGWLPGGLAVAANWACTLFGAASGSSVATTSAIGRIAIPEMLRRGYNPSLATGSVAAAGTIDALIPPSVALVIYGWYAEVSIDKLLIAGILPGLLTAVVFTGFIVVLCKARPELAPVEERTYSLRERLELVRDVWPLPVIVLGVVGAIWSGVATSTEAAAVGAGFSLLVAAARRSVSWETTRRAFSDTAGSMASLFFVVVGAVLFTRFLALSGVPDYIASGFASLGSTWAVIAAMIVFYLVLGMILDPIGVMLLTLPILIPVCRKFGLDLLWIGVLVVKLVEVGMLTPPVGFHCFVLKTVVGSQVSMAAIFRGALWFVLVDAIVIGLLIAFPQISLLLPAWMD